MVRINENEWEPMKEENTQTDMKTSDKRKTKTKEEQKKKHQKCPDSFS